MGDLDFWRGKRVFITGHTGFKGGWLSLWLHRIGAKITGYSLKPPTDPSLYEIANIGSMMESVHGDVRNLDSLSESLTKARPEIVFHLAAQPLVRESYKHPTETFEVNIIGTVHLLEAVRRCDSVRSVVIVTTDKCYENRNWIWGYREVDRLGGYDPYSSSKACAELVTSSFRDSFFADRSAAIASGRAGNAFGGGDWALDRLVPDCVRSLLQHKKILIRSPKSTRPWQHVLEPLSGYMALAQRLVEEGKAFAEAWNFGPTIKDAQTVEFIVRRLCELWGENTGYEIDYQHQPHEAAMLGLDCTKAYLRLGWHSRWSLDTSIQKTVEWTKDYVAGNDMSATCARQIDEFMES